MSYRTKALILTPELKTPCLRFRYICTTTNLIVKIEVNEVISVLVASSSANVGKSNLANLANNSNVIMTHRH